jgi:hypothetical protein
LLVLVLVLMLTLVLILTDFGKEWARPAAS